MSSDDSWTDEKHLHFLTSLEASFLRSMFENKDRLRCRHLRLDRHLPDTCESTLDLKSSSSSSYRRKTSTTTSGIARIDGRISKRSRRVSSQPHDSSNDQVVPQVENRSSFEDDRDHPNVPGARSHAASTN